MATALITGASAGIGRELSRLFAAGQHDLVLVARRLAELQALCTELEQQYRVKARAITRDLAAKGELETLLAEVGRLALDYLVNNADVRIVGSFAELPAERDAAIIELNITALVRLPAGRATRHAFAAPRADFEHRLHRRVSAGPVHGHLLRHESLREQLQRGPRIRGARHRRDRYAQLPGPPDDQGNSDALLYTMIPDIDQLDALLASQQSGWVSVAFRGASELKGNMGSAVPHATGRGINLSPFESDEFGVPRAYVQFTTTQSENSLANAMETAMVAWHKGLPTAILPTYK